MTYFWGQMTEIKKKNTQKEYATATSRENNVANETMMGYATTRSVSIPVHIPQGGFSYNKFLNIAKKIPFTPREWAAILHLSERTLQRYAQNNTAFDGIYTDRILHINQLLDIGLATFSSADAFYNWLKRDKIVFNQPLNFSSLSSTQGIQLLIEEVGRIQTGVYI